MSQSIGRGGRGSALRKALEEQARKPGDQAPPGPGGDAGASAAPAPKPAVTMGRGGGGRGSLLQSLLQQKQQQQEATGGGAQAAASQAAAPSPQRPLGRGLGALQGLQQQQQQAAQPSAPPIGGGSPGQEVERGMSRLSLDEKRRDTVHMTGTLGKPIKLTANIIRVVSKVGGITQCHVSYSPDQDSKNVRFALLNQHRERFPVKAFDGSILYIPNEPELQELVLESTRRTDESVVRVTIKVIKRVPAAECSKVFNVIFKRVMQELQLVQVGRYFYNPSTPAAVPQHKLEVWPGYITAISEQEGGLMLLADVSHRVLRTETVLQVMAHVINTKPQQFQQECMRQLIGCTVLTRYNNKTYRIDDIAWSKSPKDTFETSQGGSTSFIDYYKKQYGKEIRDRDQPLLIHKPKPREVAPGRSRDEVICLIPELSYMTGLTDDIRKDFRVMKDLAFHTRVTPQQRQMSLRKFLGNIRDTPAAHKILTDWGLDLEPDTLGYSGRVLPRETITTGKQSFQVGPQADWSREVTRSEVTRAVPLRNWLVAFTSRDGQKANDFAQMMSRVTRDLGIQTSPPQMCPLKDDRTETYVQAVRAKINPDLQLVVTIFPNPRDDRYNAIKKLCCVEAPIPSQVINARTISQQQKLRSVCQKIALQINCKLGGELWSVDIPVHNMMICGVDTYHEKAQRGMSVGGFVASLNQNCTRWFSQVCMQSPGQELIDGLKVCLTAAIREYHKVNRNFPERIVLYRDGVGDGQLNVVANYETEQLQSCFKSFSPTYNPSLAVIVVQKRINTRIFSTLGRGELDNPGPGTVVDDVITRRDMYDFFIVSQHVRQGTVSPTHYVVVNDSTGFKPDHLQRLTYKMTHMYYNWPGTVRVPAPCQYAHKLAYLVGENLRKMPSAHLSDRLFFL